MAVKLFYLEQTYEPEYNKSFEVKSKTFNDKEEADMWVAKQPPSPKFRVMRLVELENAD